MTFITNPISVTNSAGNTTTTNIGGITTLNNSGTLTSIATSMTVTDGSVFANGQSIKIDDEYIIIGTAAANILSGCTRGAFNSAAASHADLSTVTGVYIGTSELNSQPDVMVSIKTDVEGSLFFDFSNDNVSWDSKNAFVVTANKSLSFNDIKSKRYFRLRFETSSSSASTEFAAYSYYGVFRMEQKPLNESLSDSDLSTTVRSILTLKNSQGEFSNINSSFGSSIDVSLLNPVSSFGDLMTTKLIPHIQNQLTYYDGSQVASTNLFDIFAKDDSYGYGDDGQIVFLADPYNFRGKVQYTSKAIVKYRPGEGSRTKISFLLSPQRVGTQMTLGIGDYSNAFFVTQVDNDIYVMRRSGGRPTIRKLEITSGVSTDGTLRIILNGRSNYILLSNGDNISEITRKIVESPLHPWSELGWRVKKDISSVYFISDSDGEMSGTFSFISGATGLTATFTSIVTGKASNIQVIPQSLWDDPCDGTKNLPLIDFTKGNVLRISYQWLGYGQISFALINQNTGFFNIFHKIKYSNAYSIPSLEDPDGPVFIESSNIHPDISISFNGSTDVNSGANTVTDNPSGDFREELLVTYSHFGNATIGIPENYTVTFDGSSTTILVYTTNANTIYSPNHGFRDGEEVRYSAGGGTEIIGLTDNAIYYIIRKGKDYFQVAATHPDSQTHTNIQLDAPGSGTNHSFTSKRAYVKVSSPGVFQFSSLPGGSAISLTATSGTHTIKSVINNSSSITVDGSSGSVVTANTVVKNSHGFVENEVVLYEDYSGSDAISGLTSLTHYYIKDVTVNSFALAETKNSNTISISAGAGSEHRFTSMPSIASACNCGFSEGENIIIGQRYSINGRQQTTSTSDEYPLLMITNKPFFNSRKNRIVIKIKDVSVGYSKVNVSDKDATAEFRFYLNSNIVSTTSVLTEIEPGISPASYSTLTATDTLLGGKRVDTVFTRIGGDVKSLNLDLFPGDNFIITGRDPSNTGIILDCAVTWIEDI